MAERQIITSQKAMKMPEKDLRRQYSRLAYEARKRIETVAKKGGTLYGGQEFSKLSDLKGISKSDLAKKLAFTTRFLAGETTWKRYSESRARELETLQKSGFDFVNRQNLESFRNFMKEMRNAGALDGTYDSDKIAESFEDVERQNMDVEALAEKFEEVDGRYDNWADVWGEISS